VSRSTGIFIAVVFTLFLHLPESVPPLSSPAHGLNLYLNWLGLCGDKLRFIIKHSTSEELARENAAIASGKTITVNVPVQIPFFRFTKRTV